MSWLIYSIMSKLGGKFSKYVLFFFNASHFRSSFPSLLIAVARLLFANVLFFPVGTDRNEAALHHYNKGDFGFTHIVKPSQSRLWSVALSRETSKDLINKWRRKRPTWKGECRRTCWLELHSVCFLIGPAASPPVCSLRKRWDWDSHYEFKRCHR